MRSILIVILSVVVFCGCNEVPVIKDIPKPPLDSSMERLDIKIRSVNKSAIYLDSAVGFWVQAHKLCDQSNHLWAVNRRTKARIKWDSARYFWKKFERCSDSVGKDK